MESTVSGSRKRIRQNMLRRSDELFKSKNRSNLPWLVKITKELDMDVTEIVRKDFKLEF